MARVVPNQGVTAANSLNDIVPTSHCSSHPQAHLRFIGTPCRTWGYRV